MIGIELIRSAVNAIAPLLPWVALAKMTVLLLVLLVLSRVLSRWTRLRYELWLGGFAALVLLPALSAFSPIQVPVLPRSTADPIQTVANQQTTTVEDHSASSGTTATGSAADVATANGAPLPTTAEIGKPAFSWTTRHTQTSLLVVWVVGAVFVLARLFFGMLALRRLTLSARRSAKLDAFARQLCREYLVTRPVRVLVSERVHTPMTWGVRRPVVLLPTSAPQWDPERLDVVLRHELAHIKRLDVVGLLVSRVTCALYWFHPLVWLGARQFALASEYACDATVTAAGIPAQRYAQHLVAIARDARAQSGPALVVQMARPSLLRHRIQRIMAPAEAPATRPLTVAVAAIALTATAALATLGSRPAEPQQPSVVEANPAPPTPVSEPEPIEPQRPTVVATTSEPQVEPWEDRDWGNGTPVEEYAHNMFSKRVNTFVVTDDDVMIAKWNKGDSEFGAELVGDVHLSDDDRSVHSISRGGRFVVQEKRGSAKRRLEATSDRDGNVTQTIYENSKADRLGDVDEWTASALLAVARRTGIDAGRRVDQVLEKGGVDAVFEEIEEIDSGHVRGIYFREMIARGDLSKDELIRTVRAIGDDIKSDGDKTRVLLDICDYYVEDVEVTRAFFETSKTIRSSGDRTRLLINVLDRPGLDDSVAVLALGAAAGIKSDGDKTRILIGAAERFSIEGEAHDAYMDVLNSIRSSGDRSRVLIAIARGADSSPEVVNDILRATKDVRSDGDKARVLVRVLDEATIEAESADLFFETTNSIRSDGDHARVLTYLVNQGDMDVIVQRGLLESASRIRSDGDAARVLTAFANRYGVDDEIVEDFERAADSISSQGDYDRVMRAAGLGRGR